MRIRPITEWQGGLLNAFDHIYEQGGWSGKGSGPGSDPRSAAPYLCFLESTIKQKSAKLVLDLGCGDWQLFRGFNWRCAYLGVDIVTGLISDLSAKHRDEELLHFCYHDACDPALNFKLFDLILAKDLFQHLAFGQIKNIVERVNEAGVPLLFCGDLPNHRTGDIEPGGYRPVDLRSSPWNMTASEVRFFKSEPREKMICLFDHE
jgi:SAM-dependent methyltransferase